MYYSISTMLQFWTNVKDELEYNLLTQKDLAESINISYNTLQSWITKDRLPDAENAVKIAEKLNTTVEYLVTGKTSLHTKEQSRKIISALKKDINALVDKYIQN